jgi:MFS family permease
MSPTSTLSPEFQPGLDQQLPSVGNEKPSHAPSPAGPESSPPIECKDGFSALGKAEKDKEYPHGMKLVLVMASLFLALFLVALVGHLPVALSPKISSSGTQDRTIIATAIPRITDEFNSLDDVGWYGSAYMLTSCAFQLFFGKVFTFYSTKWVFLLAIGLFEVGSALCGAAPNSVSLIVGRAIQGMGSAGIFSGIIVIMVASVPLHKRPGYQGGFGAVFGIASVIGPLLGGAFTTKATWRWCFYINLPIGAITIAVIALILQVDPPQASGKRLQEQFNQLDPLGNLFFLPGVICLLLALQWGGSAYSWNSGRIIVLLILSGILLLAFMAVQIWKQDRATVPPRIIKQRSVASGFFYAILAGSAMTIFVYFIPIWFQ